MLENIIMVIAIILFIPVALILSLAIMLGNIIINLFIGDEYEL